MTTAYLVKLSVTLRSVNNLAPVPVRLGVNQNLTTIKIQETVTIHFEFEATQRCELVVEMLDKLDQEAVIIEHVEFFGIRDPKFAWAGVYRPEYPEPWATEQRQQGIVLQPELSPHTYLGWKGQWRLTFDVPVFTWIHRIQDLGWIYS